MAGQFDPRRAIVSIWHLNDRFLGSGAFITPRYVLTARHVVDKAEYRDGMRLKLVDGFDHVPIRYDAIAFPDRLDLALIRLDRDYPDQGRVSHEGKRAALEGMRVDLYGVNIDTYHRDERHGYTLGTWSDDGQGYLCDHQVRKGYSGGMAVADGCVVGVIVARHPQEQQTLIIPLHRVGDWLAKALDAAGSTTISAAQPSRAEFARKVRQEISRLLKPPKLHPLRDAVGDLDRLAPSQGEFSLEAAIARLHDAARDCLDGLPAQDSDSVAKIVAGAIDLLGWLVLLAVSEDWLGRQAVSPTHLLQAEFVKLPVRTEAGAEVVVARLRGHRATLETDDKGVRAYGSGRVPLGELELGLDGLEEIEKALWRVVFKEDPPQPFSEDAIARLEARLAVRSERSRTYYLVVPHNSETSFAGAPGLLERLHRDLPHLAVLEIGLDTGERILVLEEIDLEARICEFLLMLRDYHP